jgi:hypothetical protein
MPLWKDKVKESQLPFPSSAFKAVGSPNELSNSVIIATANLSNPILPKGL